MAELPRLLLLLGLLVLVPAGAALAHDCSGPEDCEQTAGYNAVVALAGGLLGLLSGLWASFVSSTGPANPSAPPVTFRPGLGGDLTSPPRQVPESSEPWLPGTLPAEPAPPSMTLDRIADDRPSSMEDYSREQYPEQWAQANYELGRALSMRTTGDLSDNVERSIVHYRRALEVYTRVAYPERWAALQEGLGIAHTMRLQGDRAENLERAILCFREVLRIWSPDSHPRQVARAQASLTRAERLLGELRQSPTSIPHQPDVEKTEYSIRPRAPSLSLDDDYLARPVEPVTQKVDVAAVQQRQPAPPVHFTSYYPTAIQPSGWYPLFAYAHVPDALRAVKSDSRKQLGPQAGSYGQAGALPTKVIRRGATITVVPELAGCRFNPPTASFLWLEGWHRVEFRLQVQPMLLESLPKLHPSGERGHLLDGRIAFFVGPVLVAEAKLWVLASPKAPEPIAPPRPTAVTVEPYQAVFVSYAREDTLIVERLEKAYEVLGLEYLRDVNVLRSGQSWSSALLSKIEAADVFQLCWSLAARRSPQVEREWRHALGQQRPTFIRPVYWQRPMPPPPEELQDLHFAFLELN